MQVGLLEGAAFFNLVTYMAGGMWWSLAFALGLILWILMLFPTRTRLRHWIETRRLTDM